MPIYADIQESLKKLDEEGKQRLKQYYKDMSSKKEKVPYETGLSSSESDMSDGRHVFEIHGNIGTSGEKRRVRYNINLDQLLSF
jgi:hypothetical protein